MGENLSENIESSLLDANGNDISVKSGLKNSAPQCDTDSCDSSENDAYGLKPLRKETNKDKCLKFKSYLKSKITWQFSTAYIAKIALLSAIAFVLYAFAKFPMPFAFPSFLDMHFSELPALLAGFSMGPISGCIVIVIRCLFKLPLSTTAYVGELTDLLIGIVFVLPASIIYRRRKDKKHALIGLTVGSVLVTVAAVILNRFVSIPFFVDFYFEGNFNTLLGIVKPIYPSVTMDNFYAYYLGVGIVPFNILRCIVVSFLTFILYKRLSKALHWDGTIKHRRLSGEYVVRSVEETYELAEKLEASLTGGENILLDGDLGAGKTTFTKGLAEALGVTEEVTSPTFTILNVYESGRLKLNHLDMYRIESVDELSELGIEDTVLGDGVTVIEWNKFEHLTGRIIDVKIVSGKDELRTFTIVDSLDAKKPERLSKSKAKTKKSEEV